MPISFGGRCRFVGPNMELRDWFAGQALSGLSSHPGGLLTAPSPEEISKRAYEIADAMLAEKEKK